MVKSAIASIICKTIAYFPRNSHTLNMKLQFKITILIVLIVVALAMVNIHSNTVKIKDILVNDLVLQSNSLSRTLFKENINLIADADYSELQSHLARAVKLEPKVEYIYLANGEGKIIAHTFKQQPPSHLENLILDSNHENIRFTTYSSPTGTIVHTASTSSNNNNELLHIGLRNNLVNQQLSQIQLQNSLIYIFIALIGIAFGVFLTTRVTGSLAQLATQIRNYGLGKILSSNGVNENRNNYEVNLMTNAINQMIVDRQSLENTLLHKEAEFSAIFNSMTDASVFTNLDRKIQACNPAVEKLFGYSERELIGHTTEKLYADPDDYQDQGRKRYRTGKTTATETEPYVMRYKRKDGKEIFCETRAAQVKDSKGSVIGFTGILRDVTEERKLSQELNQFKNTLDNTLDCVFMFRPDSLRFFYLNKGATEQVGYSMDELLEMTPVDIKPEYTETEFRKLLQPLLEHKSKSITFETVHRHRNGNLVPVEIFLQYIDPPNETPRFVALVRDLTERKHSEQVQYEQHQLLTLVVNNTPLIIWSTDLNGVFTLSVGKGLDNLGLKPNQVVGQSALELYKDNREIVDELQRALHGETLVSYTNTGDRCYETYYSPMRDSDDKPIGMLGLAIDITDRRQAEEELRKHRDHLEELVNQRTMELETANKELESFSYSVSHDLRAPLRSIDGFSHTLLEDYADNLDEEATEYLDRIRNAAKRMAQLIDDLLQLSRVSRSDVTYSDIDLSEMAMSITNDLVNSDKKRNVEIIIQPNLQIRGDTTLIQVMLYNLLGNAWKYTSKTKNACIEFGKDKSHGEHTYYVRDNGSGFDMKYAGKLFGAFQRLHGADEFEGTGIGLATVQRILMRHGGHAWAQAEPNKGATFYFEIS
jgi:PAS domain S-box-containing protein